MTVANQTNRIAAVGNAAIGQEVPFSFPYAATSDITVYSRVTATGVETLLAKTTNYTLTEPSDTGGTLTTVTAVAATSEIHIIRDTPKTQALDLEAGGSFSAEDVEDALDKNTRLIIENKDSLDRALRAPATDAATLDLEIPNSVDRASKVLSFDSDGNVTASEAVPEGSVTFTAFGTNMAETATATTARTLLELGWFDIRAYGAGTGESAATNATAIQAAITAAQAVGGTVFGPPGEYLIDTALDVTNSITIWMPGVTIKQDDGADQTYVLKIDVAGSKDISLFIKVDGNKDNNTAIEGIVLNGIKLSHGLIDVTALECDTGIIVEGDTEANILFLTGLECGVGILERADGAFTPNENTIFVNGHNNATHYEKESSGLGMTSVIHFSCEQASAYAAIIDGGITILNGELRGCQDGGIDLISGIAIFNNPVLRGADAEWALRVWTATNLHGSIYSTDFDGGVWIKESDESGSLYVNCRSCLSKPAIKLGDKAGENTRARRFTILPGSAAFSTTGPAVEFDYSLNSTVNLGFILTAAGDDVLFDAESDNDTLVIPVTLNDITPNVHATALNPTIKLIGYGTPPSFADVDATPSILMGNVFLSGEAAETITDFTDKAAGKEFTIISRDAITYSIAGNITGSSANIVTADGDVTKWICEDATTVVLLSFIDASQDNSSAAEGIYGQ